MSASVTYRGQEATARRLIDAQQESHKRNHVVLDERLVEQRV